MNCPKCNGTREVKPPQISGQYEALAKRLWWDLIKGCFKRRFFDYIVDHKKAVSLIDSALAAQRAQGRREAADIAVRFVNGHCYCGMTGREGELLRAAILGTASDEKTDKGEI
jgi:hypothetical protein